MSDHEDAWLDWMVLHQLRHEPDDVAKAAFMFAYRRALEDAAEDWPNIEWQIPVVDEWLRDRALLVVNGDADNTTNRT